MVWYMHASLRFAFVPYLFFSGSVGAPQRVPQVELKLKARPMNPNAQSRSEVDCPIPAFLFSFPFQCELVALEPSPAFIVEESRP